MKQYSIEDIMAKFKKKKLEQQNDILIKALKLALDNKAGTMNYAIARAMGYCYQDDGSYTR